MNEFQRQKSTVKESVSTLVDQGHQTVDAIKARVGDVGTQVRDNSSQILEATRGYVQTHPFKALGIALGLGYVAMRIRTSPMMEIAFLGAFGYLANRVLNKSGRLGNLGARGNLDRVGDIDARGDIGAGLGSTGADIG